MTAHRPIGKSDLTVFPLNLGGNVFGWTADEDASIAILDAFVDGGGNFIDSADSYSSWAPGNSGGESETMIGKWRKLTNPKNVLVATKVSRHPDFRGLIPGNVRAAANASLERLGTDTIDVYYAHYDDEDVPMDEIAHVFSELKDAGIIREIGISNFSPERIREWFASARSRGFHLPVAFQPGYHLLNRAYETDYKEVVEEEELGVFPFYALAAGFLTGKYTPDNTPESARVGSVQQFMNDRGWAVLSTMGDIANELGAHHTGIALAWLAAQPTITAPIASARTPEQLATLLEFTSITLSPEHLERLNAVSAE